MTALSQVVKLFLGGAWVDVTADIEADDPIAHSWGRSTNIDALPAGGSFSFRLDNRDGRWSPDNPVGPYYGQLVEGVTVAWLAAGSRWRVFQATSFEVVFSRPTPGSAATVVACRDDVARLQSRAMRSLLEEDVLTRSPRAYYVLSESAGNPVAETLLVDSSGNFNRSLRPAEQSSNSSPTTPGPLENLKFAEGVGPPSDGKSSLYFDNSDYNVGHVWVETTEPTRLPITARSGTSAIWGVELWVSTPVFKQAGVASGTRSLMTVVMKSNRVVTLQLVAASPPVPPFDANNFYLVINSETTNPLRSDNITISSQALSLTLAGGRTYRIRYRENRGPYPNKTLDMHVGWNGADGNVNAFGAYTVGDLNFVDDDIEVSHYRLGIAGYVGEDAGFLGPIGHVNFVPFPTVPSLTDAPSFAVGMTGPPEDAVARVQRILGYTGIATLNSIGICRPDLITFQDTDGVSALEAICTALRGEGAQVWSTAVSSGSGAVAQLSAKMSSAFRPPAPTVSIDLGLDTDGIPSITRDATGRVSTVTVESRGAKIVWQDITLVAELGEASDSIKAASSEPDELLSLAQDRVARTRTPRTRIATLTVDLATSETLTPSTILNLGPGDRVRVTGLHAPTFGRSQFDYYVLGAEESHTAARSVVTLKLTDADAPTEAMTAPSGAVAHPDSYWRADGDLSLAAGITAAAASMTLADPPPLVQSDQLVGNPDFRNISGSLVLSNAGDAAVPGAPPWTARFAFGTTSGTLQAIDGTGGARFTVSTGASEDYFYLRQILPYISRFSDRSFRVIVDVEATTAGLFYDFYTGARFNNNPSDFITIEDTASLPLTSGQIVHDFTVPDLSAAPYTVTGGSGLSFSFRVNVPSGKTGVTARIRRIQMYELTAAPRLTTNPADYPLLLGVAGECVRVTSPPVGNAVALAGRGQQGTIAAAHPSGAPVSVWLNPAAAS